MNDVKDLLELAAGPEPVVSDADVAADVARARRATRRRRSLTIGLPAAGASLAIAALALPLLLSPQQARNQEPPSAVPAQKPSAPGAGATAGQVLLVAAGLEEETKPTTGTYYLVRTAQMFDIRVRGRNKEPYMIQRTVVTEHWTGLKGGMSYIGTRSLGAKPVTPADKAAWRRAGSPTSWAVGAPTGLDHRVFSSTPEQGELLEVPRETDLFPGVGYLGSSLEQVLALPSTPEQLRPVLLGDKSRGPDADDRSYLVVSAEALLRYSPILPKVRAATLRLLATLPGAVVRHSVADGLGRKGIAVEFTLPNQGTVRMIFDATTGRFLGTEHFGGGKNTTDLGLGSGWTTATPHVPDPVLK